MFMGHIYSNEMTTEGFAPHNEGVPLRVGLSFQVRLRANPARFGLSNRSLTQSDFLERY